MENAQILTELYEVIKQSMPESSESGHPTLFCTICRKFVRT